MSIEEIQWGFQGKRNPCILGGLVEQSNCLGICGPREERFPGGGGVRSL